MNERFGGPCKGNEMTAEEVKEARRSTQWEQEAKRGELLMGARVNITTGDVIVGVGVHCNGRAFPGR
jgi:hypothetical protein